jgi:2-polyprenyl-3-methyl-5-hydroxy-6-metoxy-1,4-benzoquinol methylase
MRRGLNMMCPLCSAPCRPMPSHPDAGLFRCTGCSHAFTRLESIQHPERYEAPYFEEDHKRWFEHPNVKLFDRILSAVPVGASVADVGCGRGDFLRFAHARRPDLGLTGIDLSNNSDEAGIRFIQGDVLKLNIVARFDVVVSLAVIEHVAEVCSFAQRILRLAKPSGTVIVMTLNDGSLLYSAARLGRYVGVPLAFNRLYSVHHLHHFTRASLSNLLRENGCIVREHWDHNAPVEAMDLPVKNAQLDSILRIGLHILWIAGKATHRSYLQTIVCSVPMT